MSDRQTYARPLIALHWAIVALILVQMFTSDGMSDFFKQAPDVPGLPEGGAALAHAAFGATIFALVVIRFVLRMHYGAPPLPTNLHPALQVVSRVTHYALYAVLLALPLSGLAALLVSTAAGDVHEMLKNVLYALAAAHIAGALVHLFVLRDGVFWRMVPYGRS